jgi:hypothetical protein
MGAAGSAERTENHSVVMDPLREEISLLLKVQGIVDRFSRTIKTTKPEKARKFWAFRAKKVPTKRFIS